MIFPSFCNRVGAGQLSLSLSLMISTNESQCPKRKKRMMDGEKERPSLKHKLLAPNFSSSIWGRDIVI